MSEEEEDFVESEETQLTDDQKIEIAKWFLLNAPAGEIQYVAKDVRAILKDENLYKKAAEESFPSYNKSHLICLDFPNRSGDVLITSFSEVDKDEYLDPRTAQVAIVDHVKQVCKEVRPARDEELPSAFVEEYRSSMDAEIMKYVSETYPKGVCSVYCSKGKDVEEPGFDFELVVVISAARHSPQNFCNGSWRSIWNIEFKDEIQSIEVSGKMQVGAHYFEEGNVQLDANHECKDTTLIQSPDDSAFSLVNIIRHHETEYLASLQVLSCSCITLHPFRSRHLTLPTPSLFCPFSIKSMLPVFCSKLLTAFLLQTSYLKLPDTTFKDLRRKLPVTRTLFPWHNTAQFSLTRDIEKELGIGK
ncbi:F-actin-capping protein subunit alpha [Capsicum annuum]